MGWYDRTENSSGAVSARLATEATLVKAVVADRISVVMQNVSLILVAFLISFILNWRMAAVVGATIPLLVFASWVEVRLHVHNPASPALVHLPYASLSRSSTQPSAKIWLCGFPSRVLSALSF